MRLLPVSGKTEIIGDAGEIARQQLVELRIEDGAVVPGVQQLIQAVHAGGDARPELVRRRRALLSTTSSRLIMCFSG